MSDEKSNRIRVLVVDDSLIVRKILSCAIQQCGDLELVGVASDPYIARDMILKLRPDVITLDFEMPRMDGLTFLKKIMKYHPIPVIVISSQGQSSKAMASEALRLGAFEVLAKPSGPDSIGVLADLLPAKIRDAHASKGVVPQGVTVSAHFKRSIIAIGASTGGTEAIEKVLVEMPVDAPPILVVQHIPPIFSTAFAHRLDKLCRISVREAKDGDVVGRGQALLAPGNLHMVAQNSSNDDVKVELNDGPLVCYQKPSVDVLFKSLAKWAGLSCSAALLTGMGVDGAQGLLELRRAGANTFAQDEASCIVYGMPREAVKLGAAGRVLPLSSIAAALLESHRQMVAA